MHHFAYRRGVSHQNVLHAEEVDLTDLAATVGTPFYCYSTATLERHYRVFADAFAGAARHAGLLFDQGQLQSRRARHAGAARRRHGRGVGRRAETRARGQGAGGPDRVLGRRQDPRRDGLRARRRHLRLQRRVGAGAPRAERGGRGQGPNRAHRLPRQSGRRCQDPPQDRDRQSREQIRRAVRRGAVALRAGAPASRHRSRRRAYAYRQPDHRTGAVQECVRAVEGAGRQLARAGLRHRLRQSRRRSRHPLSPRSAARRRCPKTMPGWWPKRSAVSACGSCSSRAG